MFDLTWPLRYSGLCRLRFISTYPIREVIFDLTWPLRYSGLCRLRFISTYPIRKSFLTWRDLYGILVSVGSGLSGLSHKEVIFAHAGNLAKTVMLTKDERERNRGKRKQVGSKFRVLDAPPPPTVPHTMKNISSENMPTPSTPRKKIKWGG